MTGWPGKIQLEKDLQSQSAIFGSNGWDEFEDF